ncbi:hypothetical protein H0H92_013595, partial [Tricholoma furcatifolium]
FFREETVGTHPLLLEEYEHSSNGDLSELEIEQALLADQLPVKQEEEEQDYEEYEEEEPVVPGDFTSEGIGKKQRVRRVKGQPPERTSRRAEGLSPDHQRLETPKRVTKGKEPIRSTDETPTAGPSVTDTPVTLSVTATDLNKISILYNRRRHTVTGQPKDGVQGYYDVLLEHAQNMIVYPDEMTIREKFLEGIPEDMLVSLICDGGLAPEVNTIEEFVSEAKAYENSLKTASHYLERAKSRGLKVPATTGSSQLRASSATKRREEIKTVARPGPSKAL